MDIQPNQQLRTRTELAQVARGSASPVDSHVQLTGDTAFRSDGKYACCGSSRETILLDMTSATLTLIFKDCFKQEVDESALTERQDLENEPHTPVAQVVAPPLTQAFVLKQIVNYVAKVLQLKYFPAEVEKQIAIVVSKLSDHNVIALETLVHEKLGLCRHQALLVAYLLTQWLHDAHPDSQATVYRFRTNLRKKQTGLALHEPALIPHAMVIYKSAQNHLYLLDPTRRAVGAELGLVVDLIKLDARRRKLLSLCYETFDVNHLVHEILARYQTKINHQASASSLPVMVI